MPQTSASAALADAPGPALPKQAPAAAAAAQLTATDDELTLRYQLCRWCGNPAYQRVLCPTCASTELVPARSEGRGTILRTTVQFRNTPAERVVAMVELAEGVRVQGVVDGSVHTLRPGLSVRLAAAPQPGRELRFRVVHHLTATARPTPTGFHPYR